MPITVPQTENNLLAYFETGDVPSQDQFEELIRTFFYLQQQKQDQLDAMQAVVDDLQSQVTAGLVPLAYGRARHQSGSPPNVIVLREVGCTITAVSGLVWTVTFDNAAADADYTVFIRVGTTIVNPLARNAAYFTFSSAENVTMEFIVMP